MPTIPAMTPTPASTLPTSVLYNSERLAAVNKPMSNNTRLTHKDKSLDFHNVSLVNSIPTPPTGLTLIAYTPNLYLISLIHLLSHVLGWELDFQNSCHPNREREMRHREPAGD